MKLLAALQDQASDVFHGVFKEATYETIEALEDLHLATAYRIQLKTRTQSVSKSCKISPPPSNSWLTAPILRYPRALERKQAGHLLTG
jgi:hypothetical protein